MSTSPNVFYTFFVLYHSYDPEYFDKGQIDGANIALIWLGVIAFVIMIIALMSHHPDIMHTVVRGAVAFALPLFCDNSVR